jgi:hypothetical protein
LLRTVLHFAVVIALSLDETTDANLETKKAISEVEVPAKRHIVIDLMQKKTLKCRRNRSRTNITAITAGV